MKRFLLTIAFLFTSCAEESPREKLQAVDSIGHIYVQGDHNGHPFQADDSWGEDTSTCGTKEAPCLTIAVTLARLEGLDDVDTVWHIHLGGWSTYSSIGTANDPWDGYPSETRVYETRELPLKSSRATRNTYVWMGPRKMVAAGTQPTGFTYASYISPTRVLLLFSSPNAPTGKHGLYLRFVEGYGRELFFPHVISETTSQGLIVDSSYNAYNWNWYVANQSARFEVCEPGAHIIGDYDEASSPVLVRGDMPPAVGDDNDGVDINPTPAASRLMIYRPRYVWTGELYLDAVWSDVETRFYGPGTLRARSLTFCGGGTVIFTGVAGRVLAQDSGHDREHERAGWAAVPVVYGASPTSLSDPHAQFGGPIDMTVSGGLLYVGGRGESQGAAHLKIIHGLSVWNDEVTYPIVDVSGSTAMLDIRDGASIYVGPGDDSIWAKEGAQVRLDMDKATLGTVRAGSNTAVTPAADMFEVGDDGSLIWDRGWEPAGW